MTTNQFTIKQLQASITINPSSATPTFAGTNANTLTVGGSGDAAIKMLAEIHNAGGIDNKLDLTLWGLPLSVINQLSTFGMQINYLPKNAISLLAGDDNGLSSIYQGSIISCLVDPKQPEFAMKISANSAAAFAAAPASPASFNGGVSVVTAMQNLATQMGLNFENNGVTSQLSNAYLYGSPRDQYNTLRLHADISATIENGILAIWPKNGNRSGNAITISPQDGTLIDFPSYTARGVMLRALFNPSFAIGKQVTVSGSLLTNANATWNTYSINNILESQTPNGKWESVLFASSPKFPTPIGNNG